MDTCAVCQSPLYTVPAGIARSTNKPYSAFVACPNKHPQGNKTTPPAPVAPQNQQQEGRDEEKAMWAEKDRQSVAQTAMKSASEILASMLTSGQLAPKTLADIASDAKTMANDFYLELLRMK